VPAKFIVAEAGPPNRVASYGAAVTAKVDTPDEPKMEPVVEAVKGPWPPNGSVPLVILKL